MTALHRIGRRPLLLLWLVLIWIGLWGSVSWANVLGGIAVALVLLLTLPLPPVATAGVLHPLALARFLAFFVVDLVSSTLQVARLVLRRQRPLEQAIVAVPVTAASDQLLTLLANSISLTPGTLTLEVDRPRATLYVHAIDVSQGAGGMAGVRKKMYSVERLAVLALGSPDCRRALEAFEASHPEVTR